MIISKKKFDEKIREALAEAERERWLHDKIDRVDRECQERLNGINRHLFELEERIKSFDVVRCKDCEHKHGNGCPFYEGIIKSDNDFCSYGEKGE